MILGHVVRVDARDVRSPGPAVNLNGERTVVALKLFHNITSQHILLMSTN